MALGIGETLRATRRQQRLTLSQAAAEIRVREPYLAALEDEKFSKLGGDVYVRAFLRGYSEYLGLDPDQIVEQYRRQYERAERPPAGPTFDRPERPPPPGQERADRPAQAPAPPAPPLPPPPLPPPPPRFDRPERQAGAQSFDQRPEREAAAAFSWGRQTMPSYEGSERQAPPSFDRPKTQPPPFDRTEPQTPPPPVDRTERQVPPPLDRTELQATSTFERSGFTESPHSPPPRGGGFRDDDDDDDDLLDDERSPSRRAIILAGVLLVLLVLAFVAFRARGNAPETQLTDAPAAVETAPADGPSPAEEGPEEAPDAPPDAAPEPPQEPLTEANVEVIVGEGPSWLRATVDEEVELVGTQEPGSTFTFVGEESVVLRIGDASQVQVLLNGEDQGELGGPSEVVDLEYRIGEVP